MKKLSIDEALQLYEIIGDYIPKDATDELDFIGTIVHGIRTGDRPTDYVKAFFAYWLYIRGNNNGD